MTNMSRDGFPCLVPILSQFFRTYVTRTVLRFGVGMRVLDEPLHIFRDASVPHDGEGHNHGLDALLGVSADSNHGSQGNIVILKASQVLRPFYVDMDPDDSHHAREFFVLETSVSSASFVSIRVPTTVDSPCWSPTR